jgi:hypothetical protein
MALSMLSASHLAAPFAGTLVAAENDQWPDEQRIGMFVVHADFALADEQSALDELRQLQHDVAAALELEWPDEPTHLFLFENRRTYNAYLKRYFPSAPERRALFIKNGGPGMVFAYRSGELAADLRHEGTHALLHTALPVVPLWLDEGLAEYFEVEKTKRAYENPHAKTLTWRVLIGRPPSLNELEGIQEVDRMHSADYQHAWAWAHFLLHGPSSARTELHGYLHDLSVHKPPGILSDRLRQQMPDLEKQFVRHFRSWGKDR